MNEYDRTELADLKDRQARLERELKHLSGELQLFEERLRRQSQENITWRLATETPVTPPAPQPIPTAQPIQAQTAAIPPIIRTPVIPEAKVSPASIPSKAASFLQATSETRTVAEDVTAVKSTAAPPIPKTDEPQAKAPSFELRLGTFWLVRVGIVLVLTGLVFFGNLAYQNYISRLGPGGKITLLYLASGALLGAGWWWQRQAVKESLRNYAQVLFAGGWAATYFTTYAAHHIDRLRIIQSPLLDGILLFACAGWMVWMADRKRSEVMALLAVGLAYYTAIITRVGYFTLYSNLVLTIAAVCFLVRNRWAVLSFGSVVATYAAYGFWRFFDGSAWHWASPAEGLWSGTYFLIAYWIVFSAGALLSRGEKFAGENRASFLTINNGAFFTMFLLTMLQVREGGFWKFSLIYGGALLALSEVARRFLAAEPLASNSYLTQGLLLVTVGFISKFAGLQLALVLAAESVVLLLTGYRRENLILKTAAYLAAGLAIGWGMDGMRENDSPGLWLAVGLGALMLVNAVFVHRKTLGRDDVILRPQSSYFTSLALAVWLVATWNNTERSTFPMILMAEAVVLTLSYYVLRIREITLLGQAFVIIGQLAWVWNWLSWGHSIPWWNPAIVIGLSLGLSHWWQRQQVLRLPAQVAVAWQVIDALAIVGVLYCWASAHTLLPQWLVWSGALALGLTAYGVVTRAWYLAACGQLFVGVSALSFVSHVAQHGSGSAVALAPIAVLGVLSWATVRWFQLRPGANPQVRDPLLEIARVYRWVGLAMTITWICEYIPERERIWVLSLAGLGVFALAGYAKSREALLFSAGFTSTAVVLFWLPLLENPRVYWPDLIAILLLLTQRQIARRAPERYRLPAEGHTTVIVLGGLSLWLFVSRWVLEQASGFYLTASWSLLALGLFTCGILLRERVYRWLGLGILGCALGRVLLFDVWKLETLYRILSFMALGIVLLVLGFIYNKYQEKIREWL